MKQNRRQFFVRAARHAIAGLLGLGAGAAVLKRRRLQQRGICVNEGLCRACAVLPDCGLPRALSMKRLTKGADHDTRPRTTE